MKCCEHDLIAEDIVRHQIQNELEFKDKKFGAMWVYKIDNDNGYIFHVIRKAMHELHYLPTVTNIELSQVKISHIEVFYQYAKTNILSQGKRFKFVSNVHNVDFRNLLAGLARVDGDIIATIYDGDVVYSEVQRKPALNLFSKIATDILARGTNK